MQQAGLTPKEITIKHAIKYTDKAWNCVTSETIKNCWKKTSILPDTNHDELTDTEPFLNTPQEEIDNIQNLIDNLNYPDPLGASEFINIDEMEVDQQVLSEEEIVSGLFSNNNINNNNDVDDDVSEVTLPLPPVSHKDALLAMEKIKIYFEQQSGKLQLTDNESKSIRNIKRKIKNIEFNSKEQSKIDNYMNKTS